jgi:hypothetical protein
MRTLQRREPFFGEAVDRELLGPDFKPALEQGAIAELADLPPDLAAIQTLNDLETVVIPFAGAENDSDKTEVEQKVEHHPDYAEKGTSIALGFVPHRGENREKRLAGVKTWKATPEQLKAAEGGPALPTRRDMFEQRKKHERGKLDPVLRRLQRERLKKK